MKKILSLGLLIVLLFGLIGCGKSEENVSKDEVENLNEEIEQLLEIEGAEEVKAEESRNKSVGNLKACGEVYEDSNLSYSVIGIRENEYNNGVKYLLLKLEVYNHSNEDVNFTPMDRFALLNNKNDECSLDLLAEVDGALNGLITSENKIMGEVAFEITDDETEDYVLQIGKSFEYKDAIKIQNSDIGAIYKENFESSGIESEYLIGVPLESDQLTILVKEAKIEASDKEGKELLLLDVSVKNNDSEAISFMAGINLNGVYTASGNKLDSSVNEWTFPNDYIESGETAEGILSYYVTDKERDFYMTVTPNLDNYSDKKNIVLNIK